MSTRTGAFRDPAAAFFSGLSQGTEGGVQGGIAETLSKQHEADMARMMDKRDQDALLKAIALEQAKSDMDKQRQAEIASRYQVQAYGVPPETQGLATNFLTQSNLHPADVLSQFNADAQIPQVPPGTPGPVGMHNPDTMALLAGRDALVGAKRIPKTTGGRSGSTDPHWQTAKDVKSAFMSEFGMVENTFKNRLRTDATLRRDYTTRLLSGLRARGLDTSDPNKINDLVQGMIGSGASTQPAQ